MSRAQEQGPDPLNEADWPAEHPVTGVFTLPWIDPSARHEAALVFPLPPVAASAVELLRRELNLRAPSEFQLRPHLTLLYLGRMSGEHLLVFWQALAEFRQAQVRVVLGELGLFERRGRILNVHVRVDSLAQLSTLHEQLLCAASRFPWFERSPYVGNGYVPHITVFDRLDVEAGSLALPVFPLAGKPLALAGPRVIARQL